MATRRSPAVFARRSVDLALACLVGLVVVLILLGRGLPMTGRSTLIIGGASMEPTIPLGSAVIVDPVDRSTVRPGDIVSIQAGPQTAVYTHRVIRLLALDGVPYIETKGDANAQPDPLTIPLQAVVGRVVLVLPVVGYLMAFVSMLAGMGFVIGLGMTLVVLAFLLDTFEPRRAVSRGDPPTEAGAPTDPSALPAPSSRRLRPTRRTGAPAPASHPATARPTKHDMPVRPAKPAKPVRPAKPKRAARPVAPMVEGIVAYLPAEPIERRVARHLAARQQRLASRPW